MSRRIKPSLEDRIDQVKSKQEEYLNRLGMVPKQPKTLFEWLKEELMIGTFFLVASVVIVWIVHIFIVQILAEFLTAYTVYHFMLIPHECLHYYIAKVLGYTSRFSATPKKNKKGEYKYSIGIDPEDVGIKNDNPKWLKDRVTIAKAPYIIMIPVSIFGLTLGSVLFAQEVSGSTSNFGLGLLVGSLAVLLYHIVNWKREVGRYAKVD